VAQQDDNDPLETQEWLEALGAVLDREGIARAHFLIEALIDKARRAGGNLPFKATTAYLNTIHVNDEARNPGDGELEYRIRSFIRWNAMAMVLRSNTRASRLRPRSTMSVGITSSRVQITRMAQTWCTSKVTRRPACMRVRIWKVA
jgi:pyruvate dehydrogenase complex dehydrogenase (E1) component